MNSSNYTSLLANSKDISIQDVHELDEIIQAFPFFQSAHALRLKGLKIQNSFRYNEALKLTAAHTTDRDILFDYITSDSFSQNEISERIVQHSEMIKEIDVVAENISEQISLELDAQMKAELKKAEAILNPELFERKANSVIEMTETPEEPRPEETLQLDQPLSFDKSETHSFMEWLKLTQAKPIERNESNESPETPKQTEQQRKFDLIDKFIQKTPKLSQEATSAKPSSKKQINLAKPFTKSSDSLMTETLAKVYVQQKNYKKAIQAYKILILKNPEKSGFFADQIRAIEKLINKES